MFQRLIARQLANPSGLFGRIVTARWLNKANARMNELVLEQLAISKGNRILEVGFGGGDLLARILGSNKAELVAGVDRSRDMVQGTSKRLRHYIDEGKLELRCGDIEQLPYEAGSFTHVCSVNTIYFWPDPARAFSECHRVLKSRGRLLLCFNSKQDMQAWPIHQYGFNLYEVTEVENLLAAAGFSNIEIYSGNDPKQGRFYCVVVTVGVR